MGAFVDGGPEAFLKRPNIVECPDNAVPTFRFETIHDPSEEQWCEMFSRDEWGKWCRYEFIRNIPEILADDHTADAWRWVLKQCKGHVEFELGDSCTGYKLVRFYEMRDAVLFKLFWIG